MNDRRKTKVSQIAKLLGITVSLANIFGLYITIFGIPDWFKKEEPFKKHIVTTQDFFANPEVTLNYFRGG